MTALPTRRLEAWHYTDLKSLAAISFAETTAPVEPGWLPDLGVPRLVFVNGVYDAARSTPPDFLQPFAAVAEASQLPLALINADNARDGVTINIPAGVDAGAVLLVSHGGGGEAPVAFHPRHRITLGKGAKLTLVDVATGQGTYWHNPVTDISLHEGAALAHYRLQDECDHAFHLATIRVLAAEGASYDSFSLVTGARLSRAEFHVTLMGPNAAAHVNAAQLLGGQQHGDFTTVINHDAPNCASRQTVKSVLSGHARGVFQGKIAVKPIAQKTDGYQMNQALLLSPTAEMDIKPELEIFADDVKCSHGATIGALDPEQIFYLRSRGIPSDEARAMLIRAFLTEALEPVTFAPARELFETAIENWWSTQ
jgi:Fe-S cluster assembly protein SufD